MIKKVSYWLAVWGGLGLSPKAPGTVGTLGAIPLVFLFQLSGVYLYMLLTLLFTFCAIFVCTIYEANHEGHDNSEVVIDEVAGFLITMTWVDLTALNLLLGFTLFRLLDILKPFPIGYVDKKVGGGVGVVADDILAGIIANIILLTAVQFI